MKPTDTRTNIKMADHSFDEERYALTTMILRLEKELSVLQSEHARMKETLKEIEWQAHGHFCYACTKAQCDGHAFECPVGKILSSLTWCDKPHFIEV